MATCIPDYRLPKEILRAEIDAILDLGVEIECNCKIGEDQSIDDLITQGYGVVFLAVGAQKSRTMGIEGEDLGGVFPGIEFLNEINYGNEVKLGDSVVVVGGGDVAIDSARSAMRLGAREVTVVYRRRREDMTATYEEILGAAREGVQFRFMAIPVRIAGEDGRIKKIECVQMEPGEFDSSGRRRPVPIEGSNFTLEADSVIVAVGQTPDLTTLSSRHDLSTTPQETLLVDRENLRTSIDGVFAGGDVVSGSSTVIEAISDGIKAALAIDKYLGGKGELVETVRKRARIDEIPFDLEAEIVEQRRVEAPLLPLEKRVSNFDEVELGYSAEEAIGEARRCLHCDRKLEE